MPSINGINSSNNSLLNSTNNSIQNAKVGNFMGVAARSVNSPSESPTNLTPANKNSDSSLADLSNQLDIPASTLATIKDPASFLNNRLAQLDTPTTAKVVNILDGSSTPLNTSQLSTKEQAQAVVDKLKSLGVTDAQIVDTSQDFGGPFKQDFGNDPRRPFAVQVGDQQLNVGLILRRYASNPSEVADSQMMAELKGLGIATSGMPSASPSNLSLTAGMSAINNSAATQMSSSPSLSSANFPFGLNNSSDSLNNLELSGDDLAKAKDPASLINNRLAQLNKPTNAKVVNILDGSSTPLNPAQLSTKEQAQAVVDKLKSLGVTNAQVVDTSQDFGGPFKQDFGNDPRRPFTVQVGDQQLNVGLILNRYAGNTAAVADSQLRQELNLN